MKVILTKLKELEDALHPNNIEEGAVVVGQIPKRYFKPPTLNERFNAGVVPSGGLWTTSGVQEIIDENTFRTYSSIYKWETSEE